MRAWITSSESCALRRSRCSRSAIDGGSTKILTRSRPAFSLSACVPCQSMSNKTSCPRARRAVAMAEHVRPLQQLATPDHGLEPGGVDEMIITAVDLARPLLARRHRDRKLDAWIGVEQLARQRGLARARGRGQHQHEPAAGDGIASLVTAA